MSAASPISTSFTENRTSLVQNRMSQAVEMSMAKPYAMPCKRMITGFSHCSILVMQSWNSSTWRLKGTAVRAESVDLRERIP